MLFVVRVSSVPRLTSPILPYRYISMYAEAPSESSQLEFH